MRLGLLTILLSLAICIPTNADEQTITRFRTEYPEAAKRILSKLSTVRGEYSIRYSKKVVDSFEFARSFGKERLIEKSESVLPDKSKRTKETIYLLTEDSYFELDRVLPREKYVLRDRGERETKGLDYENRQGVPHMAALGIRPAFLYHLLNAPNAKIVEAEVKDQKTGFVTIVLRFGKTEPSGEGKFVLDPSNDWAVISQEIQYPGQQAITVRMNVTYGEKLMGVAMPKQVTIQNFGSPREVFNFTSWEFLATPTEEFSLKYYIKDRVVASTPRRRNPNWRRLLFWGLPFIILVGLTRIVYRRIH